MDYLFLRRHRRTATSKRQKNLLLKAAERQWELQFANKGTEGRKVDCALYKCILYNLEIKQVFLDSELSLKKFSVMIDTNQTYLSNVVNKYFNCNLKELLILTVWNMPKSYSMLGNVHQKNSHSDVALPLEVLFMPLLVKQSECLLCAFQLVNRIIRSQNQ